MLVATLVNVDRLNESSRWGGIVSEQIAGRLVQRGVPVTEVRLREQLALQPPQGELLLSRELREVSQAHDAQAVVVGTYAVSARHGVCQPEAGQARRATPWWPRSDYVVPVDDNVRSVAEGAVDWQRIKAVLRLA